MSNDAFDLGGKTAIITGSTRGIGLAIAEQLGHAGASCVISSEDPVAVDATVTRLKASGLSVAGQLCDVTDADALGALVDTAAQEFGGLDVLVCNAGITGESGPITDVDRDDYARVFDVDLHSVVTLANLAYPHLKGRDGGSIVLVSSIAALRGNASINAYALAKAGVAQLARNLAVQWGPDNIRTNAISPGLIRTEISEPLLNDNEFTERRMQMTPLRRPGKVGEIAAGVHFLASAASSFVTGHNLVVDGGTTITDGS